MYFVYPIPWWLAVLIVGAIGALTYAQYRHTLAPLGVGQRIVLALCRATVLALLVLFLFRPAVAAPPARGRAAKVVVLVDRSRSMRVTDADARQSRLDEAISVLKPLLPELSKQYTPEVFTIGERLQSQGLDGLVADGARSDIRGALLAVVERYRGQRLAGIVLLSDGADTSTSNESLADLPPVFAIGLGSAQGVPDREVVGLDAAEQRLDQTTIDLRVVLASRGFGRAPFVVRLLADGAEVDRRRVAPSTEGAFVDEVFTVAPKSSSATVYTAEIVADPSESIVENNRRALLVNPAGRRRRLLVLEGAPGFEHSFLTRAWSADPGLEVDVVGRKGKNIDGQDTFFIQAPAVRSALLAGGFPGRREDLYAYDGVVLANVDAHAFTTEQLTRIAEFVSERGGGLLVVGSQSFADHGLLGTPLENALPLDVSDRRASGAASATASSLSLTPNKLALTPEGETHALMRVAATSEESDRLWNQLPPLASTVPVGEARPGATVLAVALAPTGIAYPVVAVQRYGAGRTMTFSAEAAWRWKMLVPSTNRTFDTFWRQAARWIASPSPEQIALAVPDDAAPGETTIAVDVRNPEFAPVGDAEVSATVTSPEGETRTPHWRASGNARYLSSFEAGAAGVYRVTVEARRGGALLGTAERRMYVGGADREFAQPKLNEAWLRRVADGSGGRYVPPADAMRIPGWLGQTQPRRGAIGRREIWHEPLAFVLVLGLLASEWILRRRWGLR